MNQLPNDAPEAPLVRTSFPLHATLSREGISESDLRRTLFEGLQSGLLRVEGGVLTSSRDVNDAYPAKLAAAVDGSAKLNAGSTIQEILDGDAVQNKTRPWLERYLKEVAAAEQAIGAKYAQVGSLLGDPTGPVEFGGKDYETPFRKFERGAIYVSVVGTFEVHGAIYRKYSALGGPGSFLGYPTTDEQPSESGAGRCSHFHGGSIYWSPTSGAWCTHGASRAHWQHMGSDSGYLGFPVSDVEQVPAGMLSFFEFGSFITPTGADFNDFPESRMFSTVIEGDSVNATTEFGMSSSGAWFFRGHMHNDDFVGNTTNVVTVVNFVDAAGRSFAVKAERSLGGTLWGDRNDDWDQTGEDAFIRDNWGALRSASIKSVLKTTTQIGDILEILLPLGFLAIVFGSAGTKRWCGPVGSQSRDPWTGETQSRVGFVLVEPGEQCPPGY